MSPHAASNEQLLLEEFNSSSSSIRSYGSTRSVASRSKRVRRRRPGVHFQLECSSVHLVPTRQELLSEQLWYNKKDFCNIKASIRAVEQMMEFGHQLDDQESDEYSSRGIELNDDKAVRYSRVSKAQESLFFIQERAFFEGNKRASRKLLAETLSKMSATSTHEAVVRAKHDYEAAMKVHHGNDTKKGNGTIFIARGA